MKLRHSNKRLLEMTVKELSLIDQCVYIIKLMKNGHGSHVYKDYVDQLDTVDINRLNSDLSSIVDEDN